VQARVRPSSRVLWRHYRVLPQWLVVAVPFRARGGVYARGRNTSTWVGVLCIRCRCLTRGRGVPTARAVLGGRTRPGDTRLRIVRSQCRSQSGAEPKLGARCLLARERGDVRPSSRRTAQRRGRSLGVARARLDWASPKPRSGRVERLRAELNNRSRRSGTGRTGRRSEACLTTVSRRSGDRCKTHSGAKRRRLPWGSFPFGDSSSGDRYAGLPDRHHPPSGFLTLSTV